MSHVLKPNQIQAGSSLLFHLRCTSEWESSWIPSFLHPELFLLCQVELPAFPCLCIRNCPTSSPYQPCLFHSIAFSLLLVIYVHHTFRFLMWMFCCFSTHFLSRTGLEGCNPPLLSLLLFWSFSVLHCLLHGVFHSISGIFPSLLQPVSLAQLANTCTSPGELDFSRMNLKPFNKRYLCT